MTTATTAFDAIIDKLVEIEKGIQGIAEAYSRTPEAMAVYPCFINYPVRGNTFREEASTIRGLYTFGAELHVTRGVLPQSEELCRPFIYLFSEAIWNNPTLGYTVTAVRAVRFILTPLIYQKELHAGIRFEIDVKVRREAAI